ncbi:MAG: glycosyltransferase family 39 protein [Pseudomonadota bacterium]
MTSDVGTSATTPTAQLRSRVAWRRPFEAWLDGIERGWAIPLLLVIFVAVWMAFLTFAYANAGLHPDVLEAWSVGRTFEWGNAKHPPLMGWVAYLWSRVFPLTDWSFHLLAMVNAALALWVVDLITRRFVRGDKRVIVLLLLMLVPAYHFHAQRFNANSILLVLWPLATYCFLRSYETRSARWAVIAGACAALAMLGKYYSVFLIGGFVMAAVLHPQRRAYFASWAPWLSTLAGLVVLAPHLYWLAASDFAPLTYAETGHTGRGQWLAVQEAGKFVLGILAYFVPPAIAWLLMIRAHLRRFGADLRGMAAGPQLLLLVFAGTVLLPAIVGIALGADLPALWNLQALFFVVVAVVVATSFAVDRFDTVNLAATVVLLSVTTIAAAPVHAIYRNTEGYKEGRHFYRLAAEELTRQWHTLSDGPLPFVSGDDGLAFATAFYSPDHPVYGRPFHLQYAWALPSQRKLDRGWAALCFRDDAACMDWMRRVEGGRTTFVHSEFVLTARLWGRTGAGATVAALMALPHEDVGPAEMPGAEPAKDLGASRRREPSGP